MDDGWEVGRVADCQMFPLSRLRFWYGDRGKVEWGDGIRGKDEERWWGGYDRGECQTHVYSSFMGLEAALGKWKFLPSTHLRPRLLSLPSSTSNLLTSSSVCAASLAHPHLLFLLHLKRDRVTDFNWADDEYALCVTENGFKAKGGLLTSL